MAESVSDAIERDKIGKIIDEVKEFEDFIFPDYLKTLFLYTGFDNIHSIAAFNESSMLELERFAREDLPNLLDNQEVKIVYGIYASKPEMFKIREGHKKLILELVHLSINKLKKIKLTETQCSKIKRKCSCGCMCSNKSSNKKKVQRDQSSKLTVESNETSETKVVQNISNYLNGLITNYIKNLLKESNLGLQNHNKESISILSSTKEITINVSEADPNSAKIKCPLCSMFLRITNTKRKYGTHWVLSNFNKHLKNHLTLKQKQVQKTTLQKNSSILPFLINQQPTQTEDISSQEVNNVYILDQPEAVLEIGVQPPERIKMTDQNQDENTHVMEDRIEEVQELSLQPLERVNMTDENEDENQDGNRDENNHVIIDNLDEVEDFVYSRVINEANSSAAPVCVLEPPKAVKYSQRSLRIQNILMSAGANQNQTKLTDYYEILNVVEKLIDENPQVRASFNDSIKSTPIKDNSTTSIGLLQALLKTAENNSQCNAQRYRFSEPLKLFGLYIFMIGGRLLYETLYSNLSQSLPSISTLMRTLDNHPKISEGVVRFTELKDYLTKRNYPMAIFVSEDQTAILKRVNYNSNLNKLVGFLLPLCKKKGFPLTNKFYVNSVNDISRAFMNETICNNAYVFAAQPLVDKSPAFCLSIYGSDNVFQHTDVLKRWQYLIAESKKQGIEIMGFSSDGDTRCLKAMKIFTGLPSGLPAQECVTTNTIISSTINQNIEDHDENATDNLNNNHDDDVNESVYATVSPETVFEDRLSSISGNNMYSPYFQAKFDTTQPTCFQDTVHIGTKLKTRLLKDNITLPMGEQLVSRNHIEELIKTYSKDQHFLCPSHLNGKDKMNFDAIDKLSNMRVIDLLDNIPDSSATRQY
ncbi:unnamed protein product [Psylliodes chrysocephalus]|uniref:Uncharacterized protein n=1 Tax=Psylliodes chrysocephalus TaxID=3402493 RepID=A0A9P0G6F5_9CUCU|nr:unnamed protein product [Psylliodes chrysocephala]